MRKALSALLIAALLLIPSMGVDAGKNNCKPAWKCTSPTPTAIVTPRPTVVPTLPPTPPPTVPPTAPPGNYTFQDEFNDTSINPVWIRHYSCCGTLAGFDSTLARETNGNLEITAERRTNGWYTYLLDTKTTWTQKYGYFEARIKIPKGKGLWPAFWGYYDSNSAEIDTMEVCANPIGANNGNDASLLHTRVHWSGGGGAGPDTRTVDLSLNYHTFVHEWRSDHVSFFLDGVEVWRFTDTAHIPNVPLPLIINLGVGGSWCSSPDSTTPSPATMYVDWIRVKV